MSDWDFLCPPPAAGTLTTPTGEGEGEGGEAGREEREEDTIKRPSLDDFDGEIAVFQVRSFVMYIYMYMYPCRLVTFTSNSSPSYVFLVSLLVISGFFNIEKLIHVSSQVTIDLEIFVLTKLSHDKFLCIKIFVGTTPCHVNVSSAH